MRTGSRARQLSLLSVKAWRGKRHGKQSPVEFLFRNPYWHESQHNHSEGKAPSRRAGWDASWEIDFPMENGAYFELDNQLSAGWQGQKIYFQSEGRIDLGSLGAEALRIEFGSLQSNSKK